MKSFKCGGCGKRFPLDDLHGQVGLARVCSPECATTVRKEAKPVSRSRTGPKPKGERSNDVPIEVRADVYIRDKARCRYCGTPSASLHHIVYRSQGGKHEERNLICLCQTHHDLMHSDKGYWMPILQEVVRLLYSGQSVTIPEVERRMR